MQSRNGSVKTPFFTLGHQPFLSERSDFVESVHRQTAIYIRRLSRSYDSSYCSPHGAVTYPFRPTIRASPRRYRSVHAVPSEQEIYLNEKKAQNTAPRDLD